MNSHVNRATMYPAATLISAKLTTLPPPVLNEIRKRTIRNVLTRAIGMRRNETGLLLDELEGSSSVLESAFSSSTSWSRDGMRRLRSQILMDDPIWKRKSSPIKLPSRYQVCFG